MNYKRSDNKIIMTDFDSFNIKEILECGQCFRFTQISDMHYKIIAFGKILYIRQTENEVEFYPCTLSEFESLWINYFDLLTDYSAIKKTLSSDEVLKAAISYAGGIRLLNQDPFECLISFIISQNNRIPMIKQVIKNISEKYGTLSEKEYRFPTLEQLSSSDIPTLMLCKSGFRAKYIRDAVDKLSSNEVILSSLYDITTEEAKKQLISIKGVGEKVADCVLLFSLAHRDVFPTDVWVKRVMEHFYFNGNDTSIKDIHSFACEKWGKNAGYAQQYLFYYARSLQIGVNKTKNKRKQEKTEENK